MNTETFDENDVLLPYQKRWIADESPLKLAEKSRRTGITWAEAADAALTASKARSAGGTHHFYVGSNKEMAREFIDAVAMWAKAFNHAASDVQEEVFLDKDGDKEILTFVVNFASGFKVQALSSNPSNLRGMQGNVTIDEAAFHERLAEVLKAALALTMWGAKVRLISTHNGIENLFNQLIQDSRAGKKRYSIHTITLDDACRDGLYKRICQVKGMEWSQEAEDQWKSDLLRDTATEEDALEEYYCVPKNGGGAYISRSLRERAACLNDAPVIRFTGSTAFNNAGESDRMREMQEWLVENVGPLLKKLPSNLRHALGEDFARNGDLTVFAPVTVHDDTKRTVPFLVELANVPFKQQEQALYYICDRLPRRDGIALDARGNGQYLAEQARYKYGEEVQEIMLSVAYYRENMPRFKAAFEDDELKLPKHEDVITDLGQIQMYRGVPSIDDKRTTGSDGNKRHGDSAIAVFLGYIVSHQDITKYELHTIKPDGEETQRRFFGTAKENNRFDDMPHHDLRGKGIRL
ncbi:terminase family protein [Vibrio diabolicus]|uniref:terminase large subunit domain-containing protein n=1 Tax=Vibrio harveyi group TaxID=717610 RepID=UPI002160B7AE|nr:MULTISPECIES: terminase family protein [Vibrio harveyi group]EJG1589895.1 terminase family protein [Vibrio parahaemolyticus]MCS0336719.1 terminase family protein [Vibrio diabolicus]MCZ6309784.1 terminase family protein [Vibrio parahaemolyticus]MDG3046431.1 terminase family protein [Vibrio parahaemolyticus]